MLIRDLSTGGVIRQQKEIDAKGNFLLKRPARRAPPGQVQRTAKSAFDEVEPYELTDLGRQFVQLRDERSNDEDRTSRIQLAQWAITRLEASERRSYSNDHVTWRGQRAGVQHVDLVVDDWNFLSLPPGLAANNCAYPDRSPICLPVETPGALSFKMSRSAPC